MTAYLFAVLIVFAFGGVALGYWAVRGQRVALSAPADLERYVETVDLAAFQALLDPANETFLRADLSPAELRAFQRKRARVAAGYVRRVAQNAAILTRLAGLARHSPNEEAARAGAALANEAVQLRLLALVVWARLELEVLHPAAPQSLRRVAGLYATLTDRAAGVAALLEPAAGLRCARALCAR
jgi:hypothetical protein